MGGAVGVEGHAHHQGVGLPLLDQGGNRCEASVAFGSDGAQRLALFQQRRAGRRTDTLDAEIESQKGRCNRLG